MKKLLYSLVIFPTLLVIAALYFNQKPRLKTLEASKPADFQERTESNLEAESMPAPLNKLQEIYQQEAQSLKQKITNLDKQRISQSETEAKFGEISRELQKKRRFFAFQTLKDNTLTEIAAQQGYVTSAENFVINSEDSDIIILSSEIIAKSYELGNGDSLRKAVHKLSFEIKQSEEKSRNSKKLDAYYQSLEILLGAYLKKQEVSAIQDRLPELLSELSPEFGGRMQELSEKFVDSIIYALFHALKSRLSLIEIKGLIETHIPSRSGVEG